MNTLLSTAEAASLIGCDESYVRRMARQKRLKAVKVGKKSWVVTPKAVKDYVATLKKSDPKP